MFDLFGKLRIFCYFCDFCINSNNLKCLHFWIYFQTSCYFWKIEQKYCYVWGKTKQKTRMQWQEMARRSTQTPETCSIIKKSWPKASFTNTRQAPNDKRSPDEVHNYQKHDFSKIAIFLLYYSKITKIYKNLTLFQK